MAISTNGTIITRLAGALYGEYLSNASYTELASTAPATVAANFMTNDFAGKTDLQVANTILTNLGLTSITGLNNWLSAQLTAAGSTAAAKGAALVSILNSYAGMTADATYGTYAVGFNAKVNASLALSQTAGSKGGAFATSDVVVATAQTFSLTTGTNAFTGSTGNDTFDAGLSTSSLQTLNSGDRLDGGAGTDELIAVVNTAVTPTLVTGIENVTITATAAIAVDFANATGIQNLTNQSSTAGLILSGFGKATNVTVRDTNQATQVVTFSDVSGTADSATINVQNLTGSASLTVAGVETLTLNSLGSVSNVVGLSATSTKTLNVTGPAGVTLGTLGSTVNKVDASASTGTLANGVSLTTGATGATTIIGAAGNDAFTLGASTGADSVSGGDGNDAITFTANFTTADTVDGGAGTTDSLTLFTVTDAVTASASTPTTYSVTGIETITVGGVGATYGTGLAANGSITVANISATATTLNIATTGATATYDVLVGAGTVVGPAGSFTLGLGGSVASNTAKLLGALTVTDTGAGTADSITIRNNAATGSGTANYSVWNGQNIVSSGYETVTLTSGSTAGGVANAFGTVTVTGDIGGTTAETVNFSGANIVTVGVISADIVDASALTASGTSAAPTITMTTGSTATKVTGSAGIDVLFGAASSASSVYGGAGNDTINGGTGNDVLLGETGDDTLIGSTGNDSIDGGTGNDRVETGSGLAAGDTIVGGDGTDTLAITSDVTDNASGMSAVSGFEVLEIASGGSDTITMSNFTNSQTFTRVDFAENTGGTATVDNVPASVTDIRILAGAIGDTLVFDRLIDSSTNEVTISSRTGAATAVTLLTANDEETINFSGLTAADDLTLTNMNAADLKTLNITGDADFVVTVGNAISSTLLATLNASTFDGKFEPIEYLLDEFLAESFGILAGQPGIGKTSLIVEMMLIVGGFGEAMTSKLTCSHPRKVIIVSEEISQIKRLLKAYSNEFGIDVRAINDRIKLIPAKRVDKFNLIKLATNVDTHTMGDLRPWLILDTASATMAIDDENNNSEVSSFVSALKENIFEGMKAPITIATHTAKNNGNQKSDSTARGGGAFEGDATLTSTYYMNGDIRILKLRKKRYSSLFNAVRIESKLVILSGTDRYNDLQSQNVYITKMHPMSEIELLATTKESRELKKDQTHSSVRQAILNQVKSRWEAGLNNSGRLAVIDLKSTGLPKHVIENTFRELKDEGWLIEVSIPKHVQARVYGRANKQIGIYCHSEHHQIGGEPIVDEVSLFLNRLEKSQVD